ncbi:MAG: PVC-type heme-binding CxxCH protein, partial [Planctomycetota bacterium]
YVASSSSRAAWLKGWTETTLTLRTNHAKFILYQRLFPAGAVSLGANDREDTDASSHYLVFVVPGGKALPAKKTTEGQQTGSPLPIVPPGFVASIFAKEPLVRNPAALCFDARGRLFVGQGPQFRHPKPDTPGDTVRIVEDTDGDGVADRAKTFASGLNSIQSLAWKGRDLWVANAPDLTVVRDLNGDDIADEYVLVYADLGNLEHGIHGLNWAPDGKMYMSKGNSKGKNENGRHAPKPFRDVWGIGAPRGVPDHPPPRVFSAANYEKGYHDPSDDWGREGATFRAGEMGGDLEVVARGFRNPYDITFDDGFDFLGSDNDQNRGDRFFMPFFGAHFGWGHPWSAHWDGHGHLPTVPISGPVFHGSGTGTIYCASSRFPLAYRGVFFQNDWGRKVTYVLRPKWNGSLLTAEGGRVEEFAREGPGGLFRPTDIELGPDGALYIGGWGEAYGVKWRRRNEEQRNEGRVFKIWYKDLPPRPKEEWSSSKRSKPLSEWSVEELVADLSQDGVPVWRVDAQEELVRRGSEIRAELLSRLKPGSQTKAEETWTAWAIGRGANLTHAERFLEFALSAERSLNLRIQSLRVLSRLFREASSEDKSVLRSLSRRMVRAFDDPEDRIRFEAVQAAWQSRHTGFAGWLVGV